MSSRMLEEIRETPGRVAVQLKENFERNRELARRLAARPPTLMATCARGSSDHATTYLRYLVELSTGTPTLSVAPSLQSVYGVTTRLEDALFVAISQSGQSPDIVSATELARDSGALTVALVNREDSPLAKAAEVELPLHAGAEHCVAATKSFVCSLLAGAQLVAHWSDATAFFDGFDRLPEQLRAAGECDWSPLLPVLEDTESMLVLGRGVGLGIAQEAALKLKETSRLHAEAFSAAELRHGPLALVRAGYPVLVFSQRDATEATTQALVGDLRAMRAHVFEAGEGVTHPGALPVVEAVPPLLSPLTTIQSFYTFAEALARTRGLDPDVPAHLRKVTETR